MASVIVRYELTSAHRGATYTPLKWKLCPTERSNADLPFLKRNLRPFQTLVICVEADKTRSGTVLKRLDPAHEWTNVHPSKLDSLTHLFHILFFYIPPSENNSNKTFLGYLKSVL